MPDPTMTEHGICPGPSICYIYSGIKWGEDLAMAMAYCTISGPKLKSMPGTIYSTINSTTG